MKQVVYSSYWTLGLEKCRKKVNVTAWKICAKLRASSNFHENTPRPNGDPPVVYFYIGDHERIFFVINRPLIVQRFHAWVSPAIARGNWKGIKITVCIIAHDFLAVGGKAEYLDLHRGGYHYYIARIEIKDTNYGLQHYHARWFMHLKKEVNLNLILIFQFISRRSCCFSFTPITKLYLMNILKRATQYQCKISLIKISLF